MYQFIKRVVITLAVLFAVFVPLTLAQDLNRCGNIKDDKSVYTSYFSSSNGKNILEVKLSTINGTYTWADIVADQDKWDTFSPVVACSVTVDGQTFACEAERRGDWSMESPLPSLKVKFSAKKTFYKNMDRLLLNKHPWDPTRVKAKIGFELLQQVENMASLYTQLAHLIVDGQSYGIYTMLEDMDDRMMETHGLNKKSWLYKANQVSWNLAADKFVKMKNDPAYLKDNFERRWDIRGDDNHTGLIKLYNDIYDSNVDSRTVFYNNMNVDSFATWLALVYITSNNDLVFNNYGIYAPAPSASCQAAPTTPFYMMAWDFDGAWDDYYIDGSLGNVDHAMWEEGIQYFWGIRIVKRFLEVPEFVTLLEAKMKYLVEQVYSPANIKALTDQYKTIMRPLLSQQPDVSAIAWSASIADWEEALDSMAQIPTGQFSQWSNYALRPMPVNQYMKTVDNTMFFYWEKSFMLYGQAFHYLFQISINYGFTTTVVSVETNSTWVSIPLATLSSNTVYYWHVQIRNTAQPSNFQSSFNSIKRLRKVYGLLNFTTPAAAAPVAPAPVAAAVANSVTHVETSATGEQVTYHYATLDDVNADAASQGCEIDKFLSIPAGWVIAPGTAQTRQHVKAMAKAWGGAALVLADGTRVTADGKIPDGYGDVQQHLIAQVTSDSSVFVYSSNCTASQNNRILLTDNSQQQVIITPTTTSAPTTPTSTPNTVSPTTSSSGTTAAPTSSSVTTTAPTSSSVTTAAPTSSSVTTAAPGTSSPGGGNGGASTSQPATGTTQVATTTATNTTTTTTTAAANNTPTTTVASVSTAAPPTDNLDNSANVKQVYPALLVLVLVVISLSL